jgi:DNA methylase
MPRPDLPAISPELRTKLKNDIQKRGIVVPILLADDGECLDGRLRIEIAEELGLSPSEVPKTIIGQVSKAERADLRLILNTFRRQLNQAQIRELIAWELRRQPQASDRSIGLTFAVDHKTVAAVRRTLESCGEIPQMSSRDGSNGRTYRKPMVFTTSNAQAVEAQRLLGELGDDVPANHINVKKLRRMASAKDRADHLANVSRDTPALAKDFRIHHADFRSLGNLILPGSVDLALCDPPWGVEFAEHRLKFAETIFRLLKLDGLLACYTGVAHLPEFIDAFREAGLKYEWTIVGRRQVSSVRQRNLLINRWVPIVICRKGKFKAASPLNDVIEATFGDKAMHAWQQPVDEAVTLIHSLSRPGATICDLVVGSGSTAVATIEAGGHRRFVGCESDARLVKAARSRVAKALRDQAAVPIQMAHV